MFPPHLDPFLSQSVFSTLRFGLSATTPDSGFHLIKQNRQPKLFYLTSPPKFSLDKQEMHKIFPHRLASSRHRELGSDIGAQV